jgi:hypothetical protein
MDLYRQFQTDDQKEVDGVWVPLSATARIKVARMGNPRYRECIKKKSAPYRQAGLATEIPAEVYQQLVREAVAETILVGWEGLTTDGKKVPYTRETALKFCTDLKDFYSLVLTASDSMETFRVNGQAVLEKN